MELFTSFDGRISRSSFWLGILGLILISFISVFILGSFIARTGSIPRLAPLIITIILLFPAAAITVKRLHDRNKPAMPWLLIFFLPGIVSNLMKAFRIDYTVVDMKEVMETSGMMGFGRMRSMFGMGEFEMLVPGSIAMVVGLISFVVGIWALIELGFLKGTTGENSYGPDPLG
ncbi:DUF805 domain-containing protein [Profundibacter sp.]|uniref:DUF805 domain-containing protein n=1 Tax=Profundibacter sp. TaxID=3101071 RepID=UPI003D0F1ECA